MLNQQTMLAHQHYIIISPPLNNRRRFVPPLNKSATIIIMQQQQREETMRARSIAPPSCESSGCSALITVKAQKLKGSKLRPEQPVCSLSTLSTVDALSGVLHLRWKESLDGSLCNDLDESPWGTLMCGADRSTPSRRHRPFAQALDKIVSIERPCCIHGACADAPDGSRVVGELHAPHRTPERAHLQT